MPSTGVVDVWSARVAPQLPKTASPRSPMDCGAKLRDGCRLLYLSQMRQISAEAALAVSSGIVTRPNVTKAVAATDLNLNICTSPIALLTGKSNDRGVSGRSERLRGTGLVPQGRMVLPSRVAIGRPVDVPVEPERAARPSGSYSIFRSEPSLSTLSKPPRVT